MTLAERTFAALEAAGIAYAVIGAAALAAYGIARSTFDIDVLAIGRALEPSTWRSLEQPDIRVEIRHGDSDDPLRGVVHVTAATERPVDVIVGRSAWQRRALEHAAEITGWAPIVQPRDLVLLKLYAGGARDIQQLLAVIDNPAGLESQVEADIGELPADAIERWRKLGDCS